MVEVVEIPVPLGSPSVETVGRKVLAQRLGAVRHSEPSGRKVHRGREDRYMFLLTSCSERIVALAACV